jgi:hypothetical protein
MRKIEWGSGGPIEQAISHGPEPRPVVGGSGIGIIPALKYD